VTALARTEWAHSDQIPAFGDSVTFLTAFAVRPGGNDRIGWLLSYQYASRDNVQATVGPARYDGRWNHVLSTDGYVQPLRRLDLFGKFAWQSSAFATGISTDTYLWQGRAQFAISR
jgi:hypothetical protein